MLAESLKSIPSILGSCWRGIGLGYNVPSALGAFGGSSRLGKNRLSLSSRLEGVPPRRKLFEYMAGMSCFGIDSPLSDPEYFTGHLSAGSVSFVAVWSVCASSVGPVGVSIGWFSGWIVARDSFEI